MPDHTSSISIPATPGPSPGCSPTVTAQGCADALAALQEQGPLVQCLTNIVVANWTANVLLAAGAAPAMVDNPLEAPLFARVANSVLVNLGTPYEDTAEAMTGAVGAAVAGGTPWVLDPVAAGGLPWRTQHGRDLLRCGSPAIIRGNASEILGLAGGSGGRGVDASDIPDAVVETARGLARDHGCVVAVSGERDLFTDGERVIRLRGGHPWMTRVTGVGCSLGALMAAFAVVSDPLTAAVAATACLCGAAEDAARTSRGLGTFATGLLDELTLLTPERLAERVILG